MQTINEIIDKHKSEQKMIEEYTYQLIGGGEKLDVRFELEKQMAYFYSKDNKLVMGAKISLISQVTRSPENPDNFIWDWAFDDKTTYLINPFAERQKELFGSLTFEGKVKLEQKMLDLLCASIKNYFKWRYILTTPNITDSNKYFIFGFFDFVF